MPKICVQAVGLAGENNGKTLLLCALSTAQFLSTGSVKNLYAIYTQLVPRAKQIMHKIFYGIAHFSSRGFYTLTTGPINTTNLIKE
jgi:hypothetical protein